jgi:protein-tyrosine phosphatase
MVCTANQIRSPMAERLFVHGLEQRFGAVGDSVVVMSAGVRVFAPMPMHLLAQAELKRLGIAADGHVSTPLDAGVVSRAHLVLTATRAQRDEIVARVPDALNRSFTLRELAWLLRGLRPSDVPGRHLAVRVSRLPEVALPRRGVVPPLPAEDYDIADPLGGDTLDYRTAIVEIGDAVTSVLAVL